MRLLLVEDETALREGLLRQLEQRGYAVDATGDGREGLFWGREYPFDIAVIDLGLPGLSGIALIRALRAEQRLFPILILTAREGWRDKVEGLEAGADDYLVKPFHLEELAARLNALLRRVAGRATPLLRHGALALNSATQEVTLAGEALSLTAYEYRVLEYLLSRPGEVISKSELTEHIYDQDFDRDSNVIEVFIGRLRRKLDPHGGWRPIETLRGRGYRLRALDPEG